MSRSSWTRKSLQELVEKELERAVDFAMGARIDGILLEPVSIEPGKQEVQLTVIGSADSDAPSYEEYYTVTVLIQGNRCTECEHQANTYFTGIIQLRRPNETVQHEIERLLGKSLTDVKDVTGGIDYFVADHRILQNVARQVHDLFGGELTIRAQHFSYDRTTSKNLYRVNACIRLPKFWKGSVIQAGLKLFLIMNMGRSLKGVDLNTGKILSVPCKNEYPEYSTVQTTIVTTRPVITVLHPETFQTVPIANERANEAWRTLLPGSTVTIANVDEQLYLVRTD